MELEFAAAGGKPGSKMGAVDRSFKHRKARCRKGTKAMKHVLLGTTALVAAGLVVGQAQAADPIKLTLGGFYGAAAGFTVVGSGNDNGDDNGSALGKHQPMAFKNNVEIYFN